MTAESTTTSHTAESLADLKLPELWDLLEALTGTRSKAPNRKFLATKILEAQQSKLTAARVANPFAGADGIDDRIAIVRAIDTLDALADLETKTASDDAPGRKVQARVKTEFDAHRTALERVGAANEGERAIGQLSALLGNSRTHKRPGAVVLVRAGRAVLAERVESAA